MSDLRVWDVVRVDKLPESKAWGSRFEGMHCYIERIGQRSLYLYGLPSWHHLSNSGGYMENVTDIPIADVTFLEHGPLLKGDVLMQDYGDYSIRLHHECPYNIQYPTLFYGHKDIHSYRNVWDAMIAAERLQKSGLSPDEIKRLYKLIGGIL